MLIFLENCRNYTLSSFLLVVILFCDQVKKSFIFDFGKVDQRDLRLEILAIQMHVMNSPVLEPDNYIF